MDRQEVGLAIDWAAAEGWNPGLHDANCFYAADTQEGFLVGLLGDEPVATISVVKYGSSFGFVGFYIVAQVHRGCGYGIEIWNTGLARLQGRTVGLDGVIDQQENYKKSGFVLAHRNIRYEGTGVRGANAKAAIIPLSKLPFDEISTYDQQFFPDTRVQFLKCWINQPLGAALGFVQGSVLSGYGVPAPLSFRIQGRPALRRYAGHRRRPLPGIAARHPAYAPIFPGHAGGKRRRPRSR